MFEQQNALFGGSIEPGWLCDYTDQGIAARQRALDRGYRGSRSPQPRDQSLHSTPTNEDIFSTQYAVRKRLLGILIVVVYMDFETCPFLMAPAMWLLVTRRKIEVRLANKCGLCGRGFF